jgi:hypothetical protein
MATYRFWYLNCKKCRRRITLETYTGAGVARAYRKKERLQCPECRKESTYSGDDFKTSDGNVSLPGRVQFDLVTATIRLDWARAEAKRQPASPALAAFIKTSREECLSLKANIARIGRLAKLEKLSKKTKISS